MEHQVLAIIAEILQLPQEQILDDLTMKETEQWDSLKHMEIISTIETTFELELSFDDIVNMLSVKDIKKLLKAKLNGG